MLYKPKLSLFLVHINDDTAFWVRAQRGASVCPGSYPASYPTLSICVTMDKAIYLCLSFLICKMGMLIQPTSQNCQELFFFFLVLPVYCYQPISLHPHSCMLSHVTPWIAARQAPLYMDFPGKNIGLLCHFLLHVMSFK